MEDEEMQEMIMEQRELVLQKAKEGFESLDTDGNGVLDKEELKNLELAANFQDGIQGFIDEFDANEDGMISCEEFQECIGKFFDIMMVPFFIEQGNVSSEFYD